jgi:NAD(P)-dependent dehydrogenase (short-subunit alcohol dehydrogenase family)
MAADFDSRGVRVNAIAPGGIDTAILSPGTEKSVEIFRCTGLARRTKWR